MFKKDTCLNLIILLFCFIFMNGCKTTEILSDIDKGLGKVANTLASEDKVTGRMGLNFTNDNQKFKSGLNFNPDIFLFEVELLPVHNTAPKCCLGSLTGPCFILLVHNALNPSGGLYTNGV